MAFHQIFSIPKDLNKLKSRDVGIWDSDSDFSRDIGKFEFDNNWNLTLIIDSIQDPDTGFKWYWMGARVDSESPFFHYKVNLDFDMEFYGPNGASWRFVKTFNEEFKNILNCEFGLIAQYQNHLQYDMVDVTISNIKFHCQEENTWACLYDIEKNSILSWQRGI